MCTEQQAMTHSSHASLTERSLNEMTHVTSVHDPWPCYRRSCISLQHASDNGTRTNLFIQRKFEMLFFVFSEQINRLKIHAVSCLLIRAFTDLLEQYVMVVDNNDG